MDAVANVFSSGGAEVAVAIGSAALQGAITGAIVGAAVAVIKGEDDIGRTALRGAMIGGIAGGIAKGISIYQTSTMTGQPAQKVATDPLLPDAEAGKLVKPVVEVEVAKDEQGRSAQKSEELAADQNLRAASRDRVYAGIGQGLASGIGVVGAEMVSDKSSEKRVKKEIEAEKDLERLKYRHESDLVAGNVQGQYVAATAISEVPTWWDRHLLGTAPQNTGLLQA